MPRDRITKVQRWLDLIAYLVGRRVPVSVDELMERLPAYAFDRAGASETGGTGGAERASGTEHASDTAHAKETERASIRRKFERDKDELRALGIPIETVEYSMGYGLERATGYVIRRKDFYLPYLKLLAEAGEEAAAGGGSTSGGSTSAPPAKGSDTLEVGRDEATRALRGLQTLADLPAFPLAGAARSAFRKLTFDLDPQLAPPPRILFAVPPEMARARAHLDVLSPALLARKRVTFQYHGMTRDDVSQRQVHPWGLLFQHSRWYLVGWDLDRDAERMFRVDRMEDVMANPNKPNTPDYDLPEGPLLEKYRNREAWELGEPDEAVPARARFRFPTSLWAQRNQYGTLLEEEPDGASVREFEVKEPHAFLRWILSLEGEADIESPPELREGLREMARQVAALYEGGADA